MGTPYSKEIRRMVERELPEYLCGNRNIPCGKRTKNCTCRTVACAYCIKTRGLPIEEKGLLLTLARGR
jgi:hypothetical protein